MEVYSFDSWSQLDYFEQHYWEKFPECNLNMCLSTVWEDPTYYFRSFGATADFIVRCKTYGNFLWYRDENRIFKELNARGYKAEETYKELVSIDDEDHGRKLELLIEGAIHNCKNEVVRDYTKYSDLITNYDNLKYSVLDYNNEHRGIRIDSERVKVDVKVTSELLKRCTKRLQLYKVDNTDLLATKSEIESGKMVEYYTNKVGIEKLVNELFY